VERCGSFLKVPLSRARGASLPDGLEETLDRGNLYLLRQFSIQGRKVVHLGDSYHPRSSLSLASSTSGRSAGRSPGSSIENSSVEEESCGG
jgi:hypothetical protein